MYDDLEMKKMFNSVEGTTLMDMDLPATKFVIKDLLPQGLAIIGGSPKVGKSWLMLDWCVRIAKGETIWNFPTTKGTTLYVSLEDTASRLQERLLSVTDEAPNVFFTTFSFKIGEGLEEQVKNFIAEHVDRNHIHSHLVINSVNAESGYKYHSDNKEIQRLRDSSDKLCLKYGLSVIESAPSKTKGMSSREYRSADKGQSWKLGLAMAIDDAMRYAVSREHFIQLMELEGYQVKWSDTRKYITYTCPHGMKCRDNKLHEEKYLKEAMTDEFRIRKKIAERIEGTGEDEFSAGGSDGDLRFDYGEELARADSISADANRYTQYDDEHNGNAGNVERPLGYAAGAVGQADFSRRGNTANADRISGYASTASGADSDGDLDLSGELPITGWESERGILEEALFGRGTNQNQPEETNLGFSYPDDSLNHLGSDSAYLAAEVINIIDNDTHIEDCTTMKKPRHEHKNTLGGM